MDDLVLRDPASGFPNLTADQSNPLPRPLRVVHLVSVSGGKDSTATYLKALERGKPFQAVFADTGNEHPWTYEFVRTLPEKTGGPAIRWVRADFTADIERKRRYIAEQWPLKGVPADRVARALDLLHPTGNPFLDLCMMKGRFPSKKAKFCTELLKIVPIQTQVNRPLLATGHTIVSWQGVRAEESAARATLPRLQRSRDVDTGGTVWTYRPIHHLTRDEVFDLHRKHGVAWNPLYDHGMNRVGCMPCIMSRKAEIREIAIRFPEEFQRIAEWEALVGECSRAGLSSFFAHDKTPGEHQGRADIPMPGIWEVAEWSKTSRGGRQYDMMLFLHEEMGTACNAWGACE